MYYLYILYSASSDKYYVGYTDNFERRFHEHNHSESLTYTSKHRPWDLKAVFFCSESIAGAMKIEKFIKRQKSRKLLEKMIVGEELDGILAQLVRVPYLRD